MGNTVHDSETKAVGQQVITACAFIHQKFNGVEKVLLPRRAKTKKFLPGIFEIPGGHIDFGEDVVEGLKREIVEETEKEISVGDPFFVFTYLNEVKGSHSIEVVFFATFNNYQGDVKLDPDNHSEYRWFSESDIPEIVKSGKSESDPEILAIKKGFSLLEGRGLNFG